MDIYHIALFIHIVTLIAAASATAIVKLAGARRIRARTVGEALEWHNMMMSTARIFPACIVSFAVTGFYMLSFSGGPRLSVGFVDAGMLGVILLLASGGYLGAQGGGLKRVLAAAAAKDSNAQPPRLIPPMLVRVLPVVNTGIALAVTFDMVTKPQSIPVALGVLAIGIVVPFLAGLRQTAPANGGAAAAAMTS